MALQIPNNKEPSRHPAETGKTLYVYERNNAFPLQEKIMKPYPFKNNDVFCRVFNYRLSRARRMVESSFGILATRFRVFLKPIHLNPDKAQLVVQATTVLHNYLIQNSLQVYAPPGTVDREDENGNVASGFWRDEFNPVGTLFNTSQQSSNRHSKRICRILFKPTRRSVVAIPTSIMNYCKP